jgi:WD40 repeat protein
MKRKAIRHLLSMFLVGSAVLAQDVRITPHASLQMAGKEDVTALAFSSDGKLLLSADADGNIQCWDLERRISVAAVKLGEAAVFAAFLGGDHAYIGVDRTGQATVFDMLKGPTGTTFKSKAKPTRIALDAGKQFLAIATKDERIELFDLKALMPVGSIDARDKLDDILFLGFDRLGQQLVAVMALGDVVSWNPATLKLNRTMALAGGELHGSQSVVHAAATNRAANVFAVGLEEVAIPKGGIRNAVDLERRNTIVAYDWSSGTEVKRVKTTWLAEQMALGPGNDHVAVINDDDKNITLVDLRKGEVGSSVTMDVKPKAISVSDDNRWLVAGAADGQLSVWKLDFKGEANVRTASVPSLSGRIRTRSGTEPALKPGVPVKLAIMGFEAKGVPADVADICVSSMSNSLANFDYITLVERKQIESILKEQQFQLSGLTEEEGVAVGKILKADNVLLGSVGKLGSSMVLSARIISVETGKVVKGREVVCEECRDQDIYDAISMLVSTIAQ